MRTAAKNYSLGTIVAMLIALAALICASARAGGSVDPTFHAALDRSSSQLQPPTIFLLDQRQPVGGVYLFGPFTRAGGAVRYNLARFDASGALDPAFVPAKELSYSSSSLDRHSSIAGDVSYIPPYANAVQADGKLLLLVNDPAASGATKLVRLNLDGSLDAAFHGPSAGSSIDSISNTVTLPLPNGKILFFTAGVLQRLNPDGSPDPSFAAVHVTRTPDSPVTAPAIVIQADGSLLLCGIFDAVNGVARNSIARVTSAGALDTAFNPGSKTTTLWPFRGVVVQPDQKILLFGEFSSYQGTNSNGLIRVLPSGDLDPAFTGVQLTSNSGSNPRLEKVYLQLDGRILILGYFNSVNGVARAYMARLNPDGSVDGTFDSGGTTGSNTSGVPSVILQPDGKVILYGSIFRRLNTDGSLDSSFSPGGGLGSGFGYEVARLSLLPNGQFLVLGGFFSGTRNRFARLNSNGTLDQTYDPAATLLAPQSFNANAIVPTNDGKLLVAGGHLKTGAGYVYLSIERLNNDGTVDPTFNPGTGPFAGYGGFLGVASVRCVAIQPDGKIIAGGYFYSFDGVNRGGIVRLETNGSVDPSFNPGDTSQQPVPTTTALAIAPNGQIYASGKFAGQAQEDSLARINPDGTLDSTFHPARIALNGFGPVATSIAVQPDGKPVFIFAPNGGTSNPSALARFNLDGSLDATFASGASTPGIIHLAGTGRSVRVQSDGKIVLGGAFAPNTDGAVAVTHANLERFNSDGTRDSTFNAGGTGPSSDVNDVFLEPNGSIVIGGNFTYVNAIVRRGVAVLKTNGDVNETIDPGDGPDDKVTGIAAQADGKLVLTGPFTNVASVPKDGIARLLVPSGQMLNLSTRTQVLGGENVLITGFIVTGNAPKKVLLRGIGPSLPISGRLNDPVLELFDGAGISIAKNDDWRDSQEQEIRDTTIPPANDREPAIVKTVAPGSYTAVLSGKNDSAGIALVEVYDLSATMSQLGNISTRGVVGNGNNVMIGGVIVGQSANGNSATTIIRALGPSLTSHGINGALPDPTLELRDANGGLVTQNDDWRNGDQQSIQDTLIPPADDRESALVQTLTAGNYTAIVGGKNGATGVGLVEIYNLQ